MRISDWSSDVCSSDLAIPPIYVKGDPSRGLLPCADCHGPKGEGLGPANPALAGQPAVYLAAQLRAWRRGERRNDPGNVMTGISLRLIPSEIVRVAAYAASLPGRSEEHTSELQSLMRNSYAGFCLTKKQKQSLRYSARHETTQ